MNPGLFALLQERLGGAAVGNPGRERFIRKRELFLSGPIHTELEAGEFYRACCPLCGDTRRQLCISFRWDGTDGTDVAELGPRVRCWAADCMAAEGNRRHLAEVVFGGLDPGQYRQLLACWAGRKVTPNVTRLDRRPGPGKLVPLRRLPEDHPACAHLRSLGHEPVALGRAWGLEVCVQSRDHPAAEGHLIVPVVVAGVPVGWRALRAPRAAPAEGGAPPYYTLPYFDPTLALYNYDDARRWPEVLLCEQPEDVWAVGPAGVALFGSVASGCQLARLASLDPDQTLVVLVAGEAGAGLHRELVCRQKWRDFPFRSRAVLVRLPAGQTPATLPFDTVWAAVRDQAQDQGVQVII